MKRGPLGNLKPGTSNLKPETCNLWSMQSGPADDDASRRRPRAPRLIAVDGSAASGKSSVGRMLAERLGYGFLDTGIMYRAITWAALERRIDPQDAERPGRTSRRRSTWRSCVGTPGSGEATRLKVDGVDVTDRLRSPAVDDAVSAVSQVAGVRDALVRRQREIAAAGQIVMAGRDIGTVVLPDARPQAVLRCVARGARAAPAQRFRAPAAMSRARKRCSKICVGAT